MTVSGNDKFSNLPEAQMVRINQICDRFEREWQSGDEPSVESYLANSETIDRPVLTRELLAIDIRYRRVRGLSVSLPDYQRRFPDIEATWLIDTRSYVGSPAASADTSQTPQRLGEYRIISCIGEGGMGTVYKAEHEIMGRTVALKVLRSEIRAHPDLARRFQREVRAAARLSHPNVVTAYDAGSHAGVHYLVSEFVDGQDLQQLVATRGPLPADRALLCILQAARGLAYAHEQGVIHRDIKPSNLLLDKNGRVKILDMGLARLEADDQQGMAALTMSGMVLGTLAFMAPEQAADTRTADARSDIYSLGCTLFYLLTGRHVFDGDTITELIHAHAKQEAPSAAEPGKVEELDAIFQKMVCKSPEDRYQSMAKLVTTLKSFKEQSAAVTRPRTETSSAPSSLESAPIEQSVAAIPAPRPARTRRKQQNRGRSTDSTLSKPIIIVGVTTVLLILFAILNPLRNPNTADSPPDEQDPTGVTGTDSDRDPETTSQPGSTTGSGLSFNGHSSYVVAETLTRRAGDTATLEAVVVQREPRLANVISWLGPDWMALFNDGHHWGIARQVGTESRLIIAVAEARVDQRTHLAGTWDGDRLRLFIDGVPVRTDSLEFSMSNTTQGLYIGGVRRDLLPSNENDRFFNGVIESVRISSGVRYETQYDPGPLTPDNTTLALYRFDRVRGSRVADASNHGHSAQIVDAKLITD